MLRAFLIESAAMVNWRRRPLRLWVVASVVWVIGVIWLQYQLEKSLPPLPKGFHIDGGLHTPDFWLKVAVAPPVVVGVAGLILGWIIRGFRKIRIGQ